RDYGLTPFQRMLIDTTALEKVGGSAIKNLFRGHHPDPFEVKRDSILYEFQTAPVAAKLPGPKFVFMHVIAPHPSFVFDADGSDPRQRGYGSDGDPGIGPNLSRNDYRDWYKRQITFVDKQVDEMIGKILANSPKPPVIVLMGDHGPRSGINP